MGHQHLSNKELDPKIRDDIDDPSNIWLVVSTHLKNISQIGSFPQVGMKIKNIWNHHLVNFDDHK